MSGDDGQPAAGSGRGEAAAGGVTFIPAAPSPRVARMFAWYTRRLFRQKFNGVRLMHGSADTLRGRDGVEAPVIVLMTHAGWWDPLSALLLHEALTPKRATTAPMDARMLEKFAFFRKLGVFGIDPDSPASLEAMVTYVQTRFRENPRTTLWVTAQGAFHDAREAIRVRPGAASIAAKCGATAKGRGVCVLCCAVEYAFWNEQRPECLVRIEAVEPPANATTAGWLRVMQDGMERCASSLAAAVIAREPAAFEPLLGGSAARTHPVYDWWLRLRGKSASIDVRAGRGGKAAGVSAGGGVGRVSP
jgi:1-acyl-sn-glycerol-3-phosphate acyltransferase